MNAAGVVSVPVQRQQRWVDIDATLAALAAGESDRNSTNFSAEKEQFKSIPKRVPLSKLGQYTLPKRQMFTVPRCPWCPGLLYLDRLEAAFIQASNAFISLSAPFGCYRVHSDQGTIFHAACLYPSTM